MSAHRPMAVRLYAMAASLLPPDMRRDRSEVVRAFETLWHDASAGWPRVRLAARSFGALPGVLIMEWLEFAGARRAPGRTREGGGGMGLWRNLRFALRTLRKAPTFTLTSTLLVAVGVGSVTAIFTLVDHVLLRPLPYPDADRLVALDNGSFPGPFFRQLQTMSTVQDWQAGWDGTVNLVGQGEPLRAPGGPRHPRLLRLLRCPRAAGQAPAARRLPDRRRRGPERRSLAEAVRCRPGRRRAHPPGGRAPGHGGGRHGGPLLASRNARGSRGGPLAPPRLGLGRPQDPLRTSCSRSPGRSRPGPTSPPRRTR